MNELKLYLKMTLLPVIMAVSALQVYAQSMSIGNTYIHNQGESVIFGQHDFSFGSQGILPGIVGTEREDDKGYLSFSNVSVGWVGATDDQYVDGYVKFYGSTPFTFPIGDDQNYRPIATTGSAEIKAAYFRADPSIAVTTSVFGEELNPLPLGAPFDRSTKGGSINSISPIEYWDIDGQNPTNITLTWDVFSQISTLTTNDLKKLTIAGWDGSKWVPIPSEVDNVYLNKDSSTPRYDAGISSVVLGSITTIGTVVPDDYLAYTFASIGLALIGDYVWEDLDRDGVQEDNEPPLANVLVELYDEDKSYLMSTTSDPLGRYFIEGIQPGQYYVKFNSPSGFQPTLAGQGALNKNSDVTFDGFTPLITLDVNQIEFSIDGGFYTNGSIGNSVWIDDGDGVKEDGEPGLGDVVVELLNGDLTLRASTVTGPDGTYSFTNLPPGEYIVKFVLPTGYSFSPVHSVLDRSIDSDADPMTGMTESIFLLSGQDITDYDAGFSAPCLYAASIEFNHPQCGSEDGNISVSIEGNSGPYEYLWSTGEITPFIDNLPGGTYNLTIIDSDNCPRTFEIELIGGHDCDPICAEIDASVIIEGAYNSEDSTMNTMLNGLGYLPGQKPLTFFGKYTDAGQPYNKEPWYYAGSEGLAFDSRNKSDNNVNYPVETVDWVLVSLRENIDEEYVTCTRAGLLLKDGSIELVEESNCCLLDPNKEYYIVIEHRNHLIVMSPDPVPVIDGKVSFDFRDKQSYRALFGFGQKEIEPGLFAMYSANGDQYLDNESPVDINVSDLAEWLKENGFHSSYYFMDFDLNGDANVQDKGFYLENIGIFTDVPKQ